MRDSNERALVPCEHTLPGIPGDHHWQAFLDALREESLRNRVMVLLAYEGALLSHELLALKISDFDLLLQSITLCPERTKRMRGRTIYYPSYLHAMLIEYLDQQGGLLGKDDLLFVQDNSKQSLPHHTWATIVKRIARRAGTPLFKTGTFRYLRCAEMVRDGIASELIAAYAGYRVQSSMHILHPITLEVIRRELLHKPRPNKA